MILIGSFESSLRWWSIIASSGVIFAAVYMLWMFQRVMYGELDNPKNQQLEDLNAREIGIMIPLLILIFVMGVYPNPFIEKMTPALQEERAKYHLIQGEVPDDLDIEDAKRIIEERSKLRKALRYANGINNVTGRIRNNK
jgi:NADH:ubiquinone oxidoreductase subunit 4 (subunit M)